MEVTICERGTHVLKKVELSGGGRCNLTNTFEGITDLATVYPRGHRLLKQLFKTFNHNDTQEWFRRHGVALMTQPDHRVFPATEDSHTISNCLIQEAKRLGVKVFFNTQNLKLKTQNSELSFLAICTGSPTREWLSQFEETGHKIVEPVPSLFTFNIADQALRQLSGTTIDNATVFLQGSKTRSKGSLLITHWGMSGPAILRLSSYEARTLHDNNYNLTLVTNWVSQKEAEVRAELQGIKAENPQKHLHNYRPFNLPQRLWDYLLAKVFRDSSSRTWASMNDKELNRVINILTNDQYPINGKGAFKEEFVTCGGIALSSVNPATLESRTLPHLYFAGEVLDIDGVTGGFNFQAAWTTAYTVARAIVEKVKG